MHYLGQMAAFKFSFLIVNPFSLLLFKCFLSAWGPIAGLLIKRFPHHHQRIEAVFENLGFILIASS